MDDKVYLIVKYFFNLILFIKVVVFIHIKYKNKIYTIIYCIKIKYDMFILWQWRYNKEEIW